MRANNIDILKAICSFLIVCIHVPFPGIAGTYFIALARIAVPVFFMITGYFYTDVVKRGGETKQIRKILKLVIEANLFFLLWDLLYAVVSRNKNFFYNMFTQKNLLKFLLLNESPFKGHLWYLGAILYVLIIWGGVDKLGCKKILHFLIPMLLLGDLIFGKYSIVVWGKEFPYILVRNFLFVGIPYFSIGQLIRNGIIPKIEKKLLEMLIIIFSLTTLLERFLLVNLGMNAIRDHYISTTFLAIAVFLFFLFYVKQGENVAARLGRQDSTWIYIIHPMVITVLGKSVKGMEIETTYNLVRPIVVFVAAALLVDAIMELKKVGKKLVQLRKNNNGKTKRL